MKSKQLADLPRKSVEKPFNSKMIAFETDDEPRIHQPIWSEHYIICMENEEVYVNAIQNAGSVLWNYRESAGDYASGTNLTTYKRVCKAV